MRAQEEEEKKKNTNNIKINAFSQTPSNSFTVQEDDKSKKKKIENTR